MLVCVFANGTTRERVRVIYIFLQLITFSINLEFKRPIPGENNRKRRIFHWLRLGDPLLVLRRLWMETTCAGKRVQLQCSDDGPTFAL